MEASATISFLSLFLLLSSFVCEAQLSPYFYQHTCPHALATIRKTIKLAIMKERRMAASLIRLHFHDCFVQGCDGSVLLDETPTIQSEKYSLANNNSARGFNVIEDAKREVEKICPGVVSCADILAVAARDSSDALDGPSWTVKLGRRDSTTASRALADSDLPGPFSDLQGLISKFSAKGLNAREMVALSGAHTIGLAQCFLFRQRIYSNGVDIDPGFASMRRQTCPATGGDSNLAPLDFDSPFSLDNDYYKNLRQRKGLLVSDQVLFNGSFTDYIVTQYSNNTITFKEDFSAAMVKMGDISPLTGQDGIIRRICSALN